MAGSAQTRLLAGKCLVEAGGAVVMPGRRSHRYAGLDAGNSAVRCVLLERGTPVDFREWNAGSEGALEEEELYDGAAELLKEGGWDREPVLVGIPQFRCSTLSKVFPAGSEHRLREMVSFETSHLSGVSEDRFLDAFCKLESVPGEEKGQPVLIGICREQDVEELQKPYLRRKFHLSGMSMHGLSLLNAFDYLHPGALMQEKPVLLLDLGHENATVVIAAAGRVLFMGTLMFAGQRFVQALEEGNKILERHGSGLSLSEIDFNSESMHSPLLETARALDTEIQNIVEHWRSQEADAYCGQPVSEIWLSGGGARIGNLAEWLSGYAEVPVRILGPRRQGRVCPEFTIALGLALEAGGIARYSLPFLSVSLAEERLRRKRLPVLLAGCLFLVLSLFMVEVLVWHRQSRELASCREIYDRLDNCGNILPQIQMTAMNLRGKEMKIMPLVLHGRTTWDLLAACRMLSENLSGREWCVYLADYESYSGGNAEADRRKQPGSIPGENPLFGAMQPGTAESAPAEFSGSVPVNTLKDRNLDWVAAGFVPFDSAQPYHHVKNLTMKLRRKPFFQDADLLQGRSGGDRVDIFLPWVRRMKEKSREYKSFTLLIPRRKLGQGREERR